MPNGRDLRRPLDYENAKLTHPCSSGCKGLIGLVIRVEPLKLFQQKGLRIQVAFAGYDHEGGYLTRVAFRVYDDPDESLEGDAYLNPRQKHDSDLLERLSR